MRSPDLTVNPRAPRAAAICDRCQTTTNHYKLRPQMAWRGGTLAKTGLLVCRKCYDAPNPQDRSRKIAPDPIMIRDPRPPAFIDLALILTEDGFHLLEETGVATHMERSA